MNSKHSYELKCRRCGNLTEVAVSAEQLRNLDILDVSFDQEIASMADKPQVKECRSCGKQTIQDIVSFTSPAPNPYPHTVNI